MLAQPQSADSPSQKAPSCHHEVWDLVFLEAMVTTGCRLQLMSCFQPQKRVRQVRQTLVVIAMTMESLEGVGSNGKETDTD